jgi:DNA-binding response OmpR family regulator
MQIKVLVVDDDRDICDLLQYTLEKDGYSVIKANDGPSAINKFNSATPDIVLLDIMLGGIDGWDVCREIRKKSDVPIIMITSKNDTFDKVLGLELGADDYIIKPFEVKEVLARVKAVLRRSNQNKSKSEVNDLKIINFEKLSINLTNYVLKVCDKTIDTPPKEIELLYFLASNPNRVYTRDQLLDEVWGFNYYGDSRTIDVHIKRLREKLDGAKSNWELKTVWGVGYKFEIEE